MTTGLPSNDRPAAEPGSVASAIAEVLANGVLTNGSYVCRLEETAAAHAVAWNGPAVGVHRHPARHPAARPAGGRPGRRHAALGHLGHPHLRHPVRRRPVQGARRNGIRLFFDAAHARLAARSARG